MYLISYHFSNTCGAESIMTQYTFLLFRSSALRITPKGTCHSHWWPMHLSHSPAPAPATSVSRLFPWNVRATVAPLPREMAGQEPLPGVAPELLALEDPAMYVVALVVMVLLTAVWAFCGLVSYLAACTCFWKIFVQSGHRKTIYTRLRLATGRFFMLRRLTRTTWNPPFCDCKECDHGRRRLDQ